MDMTDPVLAYPKPLARKKVKAGERRAFGDHVKAVRDYVFGRERGMCRCCRARRAESMHELIARSRGGKVSRKNSVAVCGQLGNDPDFCHGLLQRHEIIFGAGQRGAESDLTFTPTTRRAADHLRVKIGESILSPLMRETDDAAMNL